jgi:O-antigen/teichoic acid export membrane protein
MNPMNQRPEETMLQARYRIQLIIWIALIFAVVIFFVMTKVIGTPPSAHDNPVLVWILMVLGALIIALSFLMKRRFMAQAVEQQSPATLQTALIIALALCESTALFGMVVFFATGSRYYYLFFIASVLGMLLHRPRRDQLRAVTFKNFGQGWTI